MRIIFLSGLFWSNHQEKLQPDKRGKGDFRCLSAVTLQVMMLSK